MAIIERGNFARAAEWLGVTPSALTQTILRLERRLDQRLLNRTTRTTRPTDAGQNLYDRLRPALAEIDAAQAEFSAPMDGIRGRLRINASSAGAAYALAPLLTGFFEHHPAIEIEIVVSDRFDDLVASGCDAGIRLGDALEKDMICVSLTGPLRWISVASPAYLARAGTPMHPNDLSQHSCINMRWPSGGHLFRWEFERGDERLQVAVVGPLCTNDVATRLHAVTDGLGIAYFLETEVSSLIKNGSVVSILTDWCPPGPGFYLFYAGNRLVTPPLRAFCDYIASCR
ncbi:LysR family transcriptional regulator [Agrobacterium vitis]|uniref:LysR family transcriptional regulator n=1 Tax=Agrobacterium vitis TaxID=373 RepID=UPI002ADDD93F|nr:LysR family transcriptional regulator [Agrobacterium vitis]